MYFYWKNWHASTWSQGSHFDREPLTALHIFVTATFMFQFSVQLKLIALDGPQLQFIAPKGCASTTYMLLFFQFNIISHVITYIGTLYNR